MLNRISNQFKRTLGTGLALALVLAFQMAAMGFLTAAPALADNAGTSDNVLPPNIGVTIQEFVENIDLKCYRIEGRPLNRGLYVEHLNPVLIDRGWPNEDPFLGLAQQLCVPVSKDGRTPPATVLPLIQWIDFNCYQIQGQPINEFINLSHLNPVLRDRGWPDEDVYVMEPQNLCVPVAKDGVMPPPDVLNVVQWLDLKSYRIRGGAPNEPIILEHLNPVIQRRQWRREQVRVQEATQLMVPIAKNGRTPPDDVLPFAQFLDFKCHRITDQPINQPMRLTHLNPVLREMQVPEETVFVMDPIQLCVPVVKDGVFPF